MKFVEGTNMKTITDKQAAFIQSLLKDRVVPEDTAARVEAHNRRDDWAISQPSKAIAWLLEQPKKAPVQNMTLAMAEGREALPTPVTPDFHSDHKRSFYAVEMKGVTMFYRVDRPKDGKWAGRTFVSVQASEDFWPIKDRTMRDEILRTIALDPQKAMLDYGLKLGRCGHCRKTLTNEESRARGIGPICWSKMGW